MAHGSPRARGEGKEGGDGDSRTGLARWSGGASARSPEPRAGPMAVAAVDRDLEQSESEVERVRERDGCAAANDGVSEVEWRSAGEVTGAEDGADGGGNGGSRSRAERERMRIRVRDWGGREGMRDWGQPGRAPGLLRCTYICRCRPSWAAGPNGAPGRHRAGLHHRAVPGPCHGPGWRPRHGLVHRAVPARARWPPGQKAGPRVVPTGLGLHGFL